MIEIDLHPERELERERERERRRKLEEDMLTRTTVAPPGITLLGLVRGFPLFESREMSGPDYRLLPADTPNTRSEEPEVDYSLGIKSRVMEMIRTYRR